MKIIDTNLLDNVSSQAKLSPRLRKNFDFSIFTDKVQRLLNALEPGTYVAPHRHVNPNKTEVFIILRGRLAVVFFDENGIPTNNVILEADGETLGIETEPGEWHMAISLEPSTVFYELKDGPYEPNNDKNFAPWAPKEGDEESKKYLNKLVKDLSLY